MRVFKLIVIPLSLLVTIGCQSTPYQTTPIVGDSMTIGSSGFPQSEGPMAWNANPYAPPAIEGPQGCPAGGCNPWAGTNEYGTGCTGESCSLPGGCPDCVGPSFVDAGAMGCAGGFCDGRCHGMCRAAIAQRMAMLQAKHEEFQRFVASRPLHTHIQQKATRHCEGAVGPQFGAVNYPYYTTRGPRDFLMANPPSIGP